MDHRHLAWGREVCAGIIHNLFVCSLSTDKISIQNKVLLPSFGCSNGRTSILLVVLCLLNMSHRGNVGSSWRGSNVVFC